MDRLMIAADQSMFSEHVIHTGIQLAMQLHAHVDIITVIDNAQVYVSSVTGFSFHSALQEMQEKALYKLGKIKNNFPQISIDITSVVGNPQQDILSIAIEKEITILVIGSGRHKDYWRTEMESTAAFIIQHADMPVLTIPFKRNRNLVHLKEYHLS